jgi:hypothetical protein
MAHPKEMNPTERLPKIGENSIEYLKGKEQKTGNIFGQKKMNL